MLYAFHVIAVVAWVGSQLLPYYRRGQEGERTMLKLQDHGLAFIALFALLGTGLPLISGILPEGKTLFNAPAGLAVMLKGLLFSLTFSFQTLLALKLHPFLSEARTPTEEEADSLSAQALRLETLQNGIRATRVLILFNLITAGVVVAASAYLTHWA